MTEGGNSRLRNWTQIIQISQASNPIIPKQPLPAKQPACRPRGRQEEGDHGRERKQRQ